MTIGVLLDEAPAPRDMWCSMEGDAAVVGNSLSLGECMEMGVAGMFLDLWIRGIALETTKIQRAAAPGDYPSTAKQPDVAAAEFDRQQD